MELPAHHIDEFIALYEKHHGVVLDRQTALEKGLKLCRLVELVVFDNEDEKYGRQQMNKPI
jgi:phosphoribosyl-dephospho-CoA transferase